MTHLARYAFSIGAAAALLAGCGASQAQVGTPNAIPQALEGATSTSYTLLHRFGRPRTGEYPVGRLLDVDSTLYGTASSGGSGPCFQGCGIVYTIGMNGAENLLYSFTPRQGVGPESGLIDVKGTFYGTTSFGGSSRGGTVYSITPNGVESVVYSFNSRANGLHPGVEPLLDVRGVLYGMTQSGGVPCHESGDGCGTVYSVTTSGEEKVLYAFKGGADGYLPEALVYVNGTFYGTTGAEGASTQCASHGGCGTFYSLSMSGKHKVLYSFVRSGGASPDGPLTDVNGTFYGTTYQGGSGNGTVYSITTAGVENVVYPFAAGYDGANPEGGVVDLDGTLYGTTSSGGLKANCHGLGCGTIYSVTTSGAETVLYRFTGASDGYFPTAHLIAKKGMLYGTTDYGGKGVLGKNLDKCCGTVFQFVP